MHNFLRSLLLASLFSFSSISQAKPSLDIAPFHPEPAPSMIGPLAPNERLAAAERLGFGYLPGPEEIAIDRNGNIYTGVADGSIKKLSRAGRVETFAETGGRPLGLDFDGEGNLIVCDTQKGLLKISPEGHVSTLVDSFGEIKFKLLDDVKVASDGKIYFSDASSKFSLEDHTLDFLEARPHGRVFVYDPATRTTELLLDQLYFANGLALSAQEDFLLIAETSRYRMTRLWLKGSRAGEREIFLDNLPGLPDTISSNGKGKFWVAYFSKRDRLIDLVQPYPWIKRLLSALPQKLLPGPKIYSFVVGYNEEGQITDNLQDPSGKNLSNITSVEEYGGELYLGSLTGEAIGVVRITQ